MKKIILLVLLFITTISLGQGKVGIGTTNPEETLHIAGESANIRVEGLNGVNNPKTNYPANVLVNSEGTLLVGYNGMRPPYINRVMGKVNVKSGLSTVNGATTIKKGKGKFLIKFDTPMNNSNYLILLSINSNLKEKNKNKNYIITYHTQTKYGFSVDIKTAESLIEYSDLEFMFKAEKIN